MLVWISGLLQPEAYFNVIDSRWEMKDRLLYDIRELAFTAIYGTI